MAARVNKAEVQSMSELEIIFFARKYTEEYLRDEGWSRWAIEELYRRYDEIDTKLSKAMARGWKGKG